FVSRERKMVRRSSRLSFQMFGERTREEIVGYRVDVASFHSQIERTSSDEEASGRLSLLGKAEAKNGKEERKALLIESISRDLGTPVSLRVRNEWKESELSLKRKTKTKRF